MMLKFGRRSKILTKFFIIVSFLEIFAATLLSLLILKLTCANQFHYFITFVFLSYGDQEFPSFIPYFFERAARLLESKILQICFLSSRWKCLFFLDVPLLGCRPAPVNTLQLLVVSGLRVMYCRELSPVSDLHRQTVAEAATTDSSQLLVTILVTMEVALTVAIWIIL